MAASIPKLVAGAAIAMLSDIPSFTQAQAIHHSRGADMDIPQTGTTVFPKRRSRLLEDTAAIGTDLASSLPFTAFLDCGLHQSAGSASAKAPSIPGSAAQLRSIVRLPGLLFCTFTSLAAGLLQGATIIDFEGPPDGTFLTNQYSGLTFSDAQIATAGISLNELEFPPHSGMNAVVDVSGPLSILFATTVASVGGYFTYASLLILTGYDASSNPISSAASAFNTNEALSGEPGSSPNEFLQISSAAGIVRLTIAGAPTGSSFALDDLTYSPQTVVVPEPPALVLAVSACLLAITVQLAKRHGGLIQPVSRMI